METNPETLAEFPPTQPHLHTPMAEQPLVLPTPRPGHKTCQLRKPLVSKVVLVKC